MDAVAGTRTRLRVIAALSLIGTPFWLLCFGWHICMAGHMEHPPYPSYQWVSDFFWVTCFVAVFISSFRVRAKRKRCLQYGSIMLVLFRILLGSAGGGGIILEIPLVLVMDVFAILYLVRPHKYALPAEQDAPLET